MGTNPFNVDDEAKDDDDKPGPAPAAPKQKIEPDEEGAIEISLEESDEDDEPSGPSRTQRRQERGRLHREAEESRAEVERLRLENVRLAAQTAALEAVRGYQQRQEPQESALDREIARVEKQKLHLYEAYNAKQSAGALSPQELEAYRKDAKELNDLHDQLKHRKYNAAQGVGGQQEDPQTAAIRAGLNLMYPDVMGNDEYRRHAVAAYNLRRVGKAPGGEQEDIAEAMRLTREKYGLKTGRPAPSEASKRKYMGASAGSTGRGAPGPGKMVMDKGMQRLADEAFPHIKDPAQRYKTWAQKVGPKFMEMRAKREGKRA